MAYPIEIVCYDPDAGRRVKMRLVGEHGPYLIYESEVTGRQVLILKGEVWRFAS